MAAAVTLIGCNAPNDQQQRQAEDTVSKAWQSTKDAAQKAGVSIQKSTEQAAQTSRIWSPLKSSKDIDASNVSVETVGKTVYLNGSVPTSKMRDRADAMARAIADSDYTVQDNLKVGEPGSQTAPRITDDQPVSNG